jgi:branched-chain amino acid transport system permease protein
MQLPFVSCLLSFLLDGFSRGEGMYYSQILLFSAVSAILAAGAYLPLSSGRLVACFGSFMGIGAILSAVAYSKMGLSFGLALVVGATGSALFGLLVGSLCIKLEGFLFSVATLGIGEAMHVIVLNSPMLGGALGFRAVELIPSNVYATSALAFTLLALSYYEGTLARRAMAVLRSHQAMGLSMGINPNSVRVWGISAGAFMAGLAGGIYIHSVGILDPGIFGFAKSVEVLMYAVVGGTVSFWGPVVSASVLTAIPEVLRFSASFRMVLYGACIVAVVVLRPDGLWVSHKIKRMWRVR